MTGSHPGLALQSTYGPVCRHSPSPRVAVTAASRVLLAFLLLALGSATTALAQSLESMQAMEARLLERRLKEYGEADKRARAAENLYRETRQRLSAVLGDSSVSLDQLRELEAETSLARERAYLRDKESTDLRREIYSHLERIDEFAREIDGLGPRLSGEWQIDFGKDYGSGTVTFRMSGERVDGTYRLSNGATGPIRGEIIARSVSLVRYGPGGNSQLQLRGSMSADGQSMSGEWISQELAEGRNSIGSWAARRVN